MDVFHLGRVFFFKFLFHVFVFQVFPIIRALFIKTTLCGNHIENEEVEISGRKIDITYIRKKLLEKNEKFMRKRSDEVFDNMDRESINENLQKLNEVAV